MTLRVGLALVAALVVAVPARGATIADIGAWCWFADPRAIDFNGRAVFGWVGDDGSIMVGDQRTRANVDPQFQRDDHDNPALYIRKDGLLMAFWSAHVGNALYYRTAHDGLGSWGTRKTAPANPAGSWGYTYPNPRRVGDTLYLFWSAGCNGSCGGTATYATTTNDGASWSPARSLFDPTKTPVRYIKYETAGNEIHMAWNLGHPRDVQSGIYHAIIRDGRIWRRDGTQIGTLGVPLDPTAGELVYRPTTSGGAWIHDLAVTDGRPFIVYATFPTTENHLYRFARWEGRWYDEPIAFSGPSFDPGRVEVYYSGGISLNHGNPYELYLSRKVAEGWAIERWLRRSDSWERRRINVGPEPNVRPYRVAGGLAWMQGDYPSFTGFQTALVWDSSTAPAPLPPQPVSTPDQQPTQAVGVAAPCARAVQRWRRTHSRRALRKYWACRARNGGCRRLHTRWRQTRSDLLLRVYRRNCRR